MIALQHERLATGRSIAYRRVGTGPCLVLLHGFTHDSRVWGPQLEDLPTDFDVIAWDAPGAGSSPDPPDTFTIADWADELAMFLSALHVERADVVGLSWGGLLAQELYRRHEARVRTLILADTYAGWKGSLPKGAAELRLAAAIRDSRLSPAEFVPRYLPAMFGPAPPRKAQEQLARIMAQFHPLGFRLMATALAICDTTDLLPQIRVPTLLIWGDQDARSPIEVGQRLHHAIPGSELAVIRGAGHVSNLEDAEAFDACVRRFLGSPSGGIVAAFAGMAGPADKRALDDGFGRVLAPTVRESLRQGQAGWARDNVVRMGPWHFDLGAIRCPTTIWLGIQDVLNVDAGPWLGKWIPHARVNILEDRGHFAIFEAWDQVLDSLGFLPT